MLKQHPSHHSHEIYKFNLRQLKTICVFGKSPRFTEGSGRCSPKADHPWRTEGHAPQPENFIIKVLRKVIAALQGITVGFFFFHVFETKEGFASRKQSRRKNFA